MTHSSRAHFILGVLLIATLVPAAGLAFLQYQALSNMRTQTRQALLESLKQRLVGARVEVETDFLAWPRNALLGDEHHDWLRRGDLRRIHDLSQITRRVCPHVSLFFAYRLSGTNDRARVWIFRPTPEPRHMRLSENDPAEVEIRRLVPTIVLNKFHFYNFYTDLNGERHQVFLDLPPEVRQTVKTLFAVR